MADILTFSLGEMRSKLEHALAFEKNPALLRLPEQERTVLGLASIYLPRRTEEITGFRSYREAIASALGLDPSARAEDGAARVQRCRESLITAWKLLPARYFDADGYIMDPERRTVHASDCAECGRGLAHDEPCLGVLETPVEELARLRSKIARTEQT